MRTFKKKLGIFNCRVSKYDFLTSATFRPEGKDSGEDVCRIYFLPGTVKDERDILEELHKCYPQNADLKLRISVQLYDLLYRCTCQATLLKKIADLK